ncbi:MAG: glucuronate isomerase [Chitinophagaceae bacterium]
MKSFITDNFLLETKTARKLYFDHVQFLPIRDYHNHLPPDEVATNKRFKTITELWLKGDHYKWRAMRANAVPERFITGNATDEEKFKAWAATVPYTLRNPLYHWTHLELKQPFKINELLTEKSANKIYKRCNELLQAKYTVHEILKYHKVELLCTTDAATDDLQYHEIIKSKNIFVKVFPTFRPDILINFSDNEKWLQQIELLSNRSPASIIDLDSFLEALQKRVNYFYKRGCRLSDHGLEFMPLFVGRTKKIENIFLQLITKKNIQNKLDLELLQAYVLHELCKMYHQKNWVQQFHLGALRNNNTRLFNLPGNDAGADSIGDFQQAKNLSIFLNALDKENKLAKTILYNLNPADNEVFATMCGNFQDETVPNKIQLGSAWWFLDQKDGMEKQLNALSRLGLLSHFVGMVTDSRSFLSFSRHDYFRRILCNLIGNDIEKGELPNDEKWLGKMLADICYHNAKNYFNWNS